MKKLLILILSLCVGLALAEEKKVALLIGIDQYSGRVFSPLSTPSKDAEAMLYMLQFLGFDKDNTIKSTPKADMNEIRKLLDQFDAAAEQADVALFYFSGHGLSKSNRGNAAPDMYLVPSGRYDKPSSIHGQSLELDEVCKRIDETGAKLKIFIIDACRNSFDHKGAFDPEEFVRMVEERKKSEGTVFFFSSDYGEKSEVGDGPLSAFTQVLVNHLPDTDNMEVVWRKIQREVAQNSENLQNPVCSYDSDKNPDLLRNNYFNRDGKSINPSQVIEGKGSVTFQLTPSDAKITFTQSDMTFSNGATVVLALGQTYKYVISADGYQNYENTISITPYSQKMFSFSLNKLEPATLRVLTGKASNSEIYFDGEYMGKSPLKISTLSGNHSIRIKHKYYYESTNSINLVPGDQERVFELTEKSDVWKNYNDERFHEVSYHFSPKSQFGLSYLFTPEDSRFSIGGLVSVSTGLFKIYDNIYIGNSSESSTSSTIVDGVQYTKIREMIPASETGYSSEVDPNGEAKHYDANFTALVLGGYHFCNIFALECGLGVGGHRDLYYMENAYAKWKTTLKDPDTQKIVGLPTYSVEKTYKSQLYKSAFTWSPVLRVGGRFYVPTYGFDDAISIGIGYNYYPKTTTMNSFDISVGFRFEL